MRQFITRIFQYKQRQTNRIVQQLYYPETEQQRTVNQPKRVKTIQDLLDSFQDTNLDQWFRSMWSLQKKEIINQDFWNNRDFKQIREQILDDVDNCILAKNYYRRMFNQIDFTLEQQLLKQILQSEKLSTLKAIAAFYRSFNRFSSEQLQLFKLTIQDHYQTNNDQSSSDFLKGFLMTRSKIIAETIVPNEKNFMYLATYKLKFDLFPQNELYETSLLQLIKDNLYTLNVQQSIEILSSYLKMDQGDLPLYRGLLWNIVRYKNLLQSHHLSNLCYIFLHLRNFKFKKFDLDFQSGYFDLIDTLVILSIKNRKPNQAQALIQIGRQNAITRELVQILSTQLIGFKVRPEIIYIATNMGALGPSMFDYAKYIGNSLLIEFEEQEVKGQLPGKQESGNLDGRQYIDLVQNRLEQLVLITWCIVYQHHELKSTQTQVPFDILNSLIYYANQSIELLDGWKDEEVHLSLDFMKCLPQINYYIETRGKKMFGAKLNYEKIRSWELLRVYRRYNKRTQAYKHELMEYLILINKYEVERYVNWKGYIFDFRYETEDGRTVYGNINGVEMHMNGEEMNIVKFQRELLQGIPHVEIGFDRIPKQKLVIEERLEGMMPRLKEVDTETRSLLVEMKQSLVEIYGEQKKNNERWRRVEKIIRESEMDVEKEERDDEYVLSDEEE